MSTCKLCLLAATCLQVELAIADFSSFVHTQVELTVAVIGDLR